MNTQTFKVVSTCSNTIFDHFEQLDTSFIAKDKSSCLLRIGQTTLVSSNSNQLIGKGVSGYVEIVFQATETQAGFKEDRNKPLALKQMGVPKLSTPEEFKQNFSREVKLQRLVDSHPNVATIHGACVKASKKNDKVEGLILMEHYQKSVAKVLRKQKPSEILVKKWTRQLLDFLSCLDSINMIHGDLKPENLMLDCNDNIIVIDFGNAQLNPTQILPPTFKYADPSLIGKAAKGAPQKGFLKFDLWSVGVLLLELVGQSKKVNGFEHMRRAMTLDGQAYVNTYIDPICNENEETWWAPAVRALTMPLDQRKSPAEINKLIV